MTIYKTIILFISVLLVQTICFSQQQDTVTQAYVAVQAYEVDFSTVSMVEDVQMADFQGSYHFGESEGESQLMILFSNGKLFACSKYYEWQQDGFHEKVDRQKVDFVDGKIKIGKVLYELYQCTETTYLTLEKGEKVLVSHHYEDSPENVFHYIQINSGTDIEPRKGRFPETSFVKLTEADLSGYSAHELKIMRNEIFARNGYTFKQGGEMESYFLKTDWYNAVQKQKEVVLSDIEKHNVALLLQLEKN